MVCTHSQKFIYYPSFNVQFDLGGTMREMTNDWAHFHLSYTRNSCEHELFDWQTIGVHCTRIVRNVLTFGHVCASCEYTF